MRGLFIITLEQINIVNCYERKIICDKPIVLAPGMGRDSSVGIATIYGDRIAVSLSWPLRPQCLKSSLTWVAGHSENFTPTHFFHPPNKDQIVRLLFTPLYSHPSWRWCHILRQLHQLRTNQPPESGIGGVGNKRVTSKRGYQYQRLDGEACIFCCWQGCQDSC